MNKREKQRRQTHIDYNRRCFDRRGKTFYYQRSVHIGDTQFMGGTVYYAQYWDFVGEAREELLRYLLQDDLNRLLSEQIMLITATCKGEYKAPLFCYDPIRIDVKIKKVTKATIYLGFEVKKNKDTLSFLANMKLCLAQNNKIIKIPDFFYDVLKQYEI